MCLEGGGKYNGRWAYSEAHLHVSKALRRALESWCLEFSIPSLKEPFGFMKAESIPVLRDGEPLPYILEMNNDW